MSINIFHDMKEQHVWAYVVTLVVTGIVIIISIANYYSHNENLIIQELLREGHDPLELACLYNHSNDIQMSCFTLFSAQVKEPIGENKE